MSESPPQIFISYARADDESPPEDAGKKGFVSALHDQLNYLFKNLGNPRPSIWRDTNKVEAADLFDEKISKAVAGSSILVVVLSPNWMDSAYCRKELDWFRERWRAEGENGVRHRIVVVCKRHVDPDRRPSLLQGQTGYQFYSRDDPDEEGLEREYFLRGEERDKRYYDEIEKLAGVLWRRARRFKETITGADDEHTDPPPLPPRSDGAGVVFVAKPATDMREAYDRVVSELEGAGYRVVPDRTQDLPLDASATAFIEAALRDACVSVHLLGEKPGFTPDGSDPIVRLQLLCAARRQDGDDQTPFQRIIWAPKVLEDGVQTDVVRDPFDVLGQFDAFRQRSDKVESSTRSKFVELLLQTLARQQVKPAPANEAGGNGKVYVYHVQEDLEHAVAVARALKARKINWSLPGFDGSPAENAQLHLQYMRQCDSVILCWAKATDVWIKAQTNGLSDWKQLGRTRGFTRRAVVALPPPGVPKKVFVDLLPEDEIDVALDLTGRERLLPEDVDRLVGA